MRVISKKFRRKQENKKKYYLEKVIEMNREACYRASRPVNPLGFEEKGDFLVTKVEVLAIFAQADGFLRPDEVGERLPSRLRSTFFV